MSFLHRSAIRLNSDAIRVIRHEDRVPPMVSIALSDGTTDCFEFEDTEAIDALMEVLPQAKEQLLADIMAATGEGDAQ